MSAGVAQKRPRLVLPSEMLNEADAALYRAKQTGRDRVAVAGMSQAVLQSA